MTRSQVQVPGGLAGAGLHHEVLKSYQLYQSCFPPLLFDVDKHSQGPQQYIGTSKARAKALRVDLCIGLAALRVF